MTKVKREVPKAGTKNEEVGKEREDPVSRGNIIQKTGRKGGLKFGPTQWSIRGGKGKGRLLRKGDKFWKERPWKKPIAGKGQKLTTGKIERATEEKKKSLNGF